MNLTSNPVTVDHSYDNDFYIASMSVNGANTVTLSYDDADGLLTQAGAVTLERHGPEGRVSKVRMGQTGQQLDEVRTYNAFGELAGISATLNGSSLLNLTYPTRDGLGRVMQATESIDNGSTTTLVYGYDSPGRLRDVTRNGVPVAPSPAYTYDANGNRQTAPGLLGTPTYDDQDRLTQYNGILYQYTANGELLTKTVGTAETTYHYDGLGQLRTVTLPNGTVIDYVIDTASRRVGKQITVGTTTTFVQGFVYDDQLRCAAQVDSVGSVVARFVYASRDNVPDYMVKNGVTYRLVADELGSVRLVVNGATGAIAQRIDYDEFGRPTLVVGSWDVQPFGFAGGLYDADTGLVRFGARDYDPTTARWTTKDPIGFAGGNTNLYGYAFNDPVNGLDPSGLTQLDVDVAYHLIQESFPDLYVSPNVVVDIPRGGSLGYTEPYLARTMHLNKEYLDDLDSGEDLLTTMLHETHHANDWFPKRMHDLMDTDHKDAEDWAEKHARDLDDEFEKRRKQAADDGPCL